MLVQIVCIVADAQLSAWVACADAERDRSAAGRLFRYLGVGVGATQGCFTRNVQLWSA